MLCTLTRDRTCGAEEAYSVIRNAKKGAQEGRLTLFYADEVGFTLALGVTKTWTKRGSGIQFKIPTRPSSEGRLNILGALNYASQELHCQDLKGNGTAEKFAVFIDKLAKKAEPEGLTVVVIDNASIHKAGLIKEKVAAWNAQGGG